MVVVVVGRGSARPGLGAGGRGGGRRAGAGRGAWGVGGAPSCHGGRATRDPPTHCPGAAPPPPLLGHEAGRQTGGRARGAGGRAGAVAAWRAWGRLLAGGRWGGASERVSRARVRAMAARRPGWAGGFVPGRTRAAGPGRAGPCGGQEAGVAVAAAAARGSSVPAACGGRRGWVCEGGPGAGGSLGRRIGCGRWARGGRAEAPGVTPLPIAFAELAGVMASEHVNGNGTEEPMDTSAAVSHSEHFQTLLDAGLPQKVAEKLDEIYVAGKVWNWHRHSLHASIGQTLLALG